MKRLLSISLFLLAAACSRQPAEDTNNEPLPDTTAVGNVTSNAAWPASLPVFGDGYPTEGDPCRRVGKSPATSNFLDDSADLVACPTPAQAASLGGPTVATVDGVPLVSVPSKSRAAAASDAIRGPGGLEEKCRAEVARVTNARVKGTGRISQSGDKVEILVDIEGAVAPWRCRGTADGKLGDVEFTQEG